MNPNMERIDLDELRQGFRSKPFCKLVEHHLVRQKQEERIHGIMGTIASLPKEIQPLAEGFIDRWNTRAYDKAVWQKDTSLVFVSLRGDQAALFSHPTGLPSALKGIAFTG
jgi:hypothetical protein